MRTIPANPLHEAGEAGEKIARPVGSLVQWALANLEGLAIGALVAAAIVGVMLVARWFGRRMLAANPDCSNWRGVFGSVLAKTTMAFMVAAAVEIVTSYAPVPSRLDRIVNALFIVVTAIQVAIWAREIILGIIRSRVGEEPGESTLGNAMAIIRVLVSVTVFAVALLFILDNLGVNVTTLVAGLGIGGIAIGLAAQGIFSDLFAALSILFDRPFRRGDLIRYGTTTGTVERIGLKTTRVRAVSGEQVIMANTKLLEQEVQNLADTRVRRVVVPFGLVYQTAPDVLERLPEIVDQAIKPIKSCRLVRCLVTAFSPSAIDCELVYDDRSSDPDTIARHKSQVLIAIAQLFASERIGFAYPTQTTFTAAPDGSYIMPWAPPAKA